MKLRLLSLCAASRMWVRHQSVVIVPPEGGLEFSTGLTKKIVFYLCHGQQIVSDLPYKIVIESRNTHASSSSQEALLRKVAAQGSREKRERSQSVPKYQRSQSVPFTLPASNSLFLPRLSSLPLAPPRALMKEGAWTCTLLSGR